MKKLLFIRFVVVISTSCSHNVEQSQLSGVWIEATHKTDTMVFENSSKGFVLNRGKEVVNGYLLPKIHSGPYLYELKNDSIALINQLSGNSKRINYYFKLDLIMNQFKIGNFYVDSIGKTEILTFSKIR